MIQSVTRSAVVRTTTLYLFLSRYVNTLHDKPIKGFRSVHGSNPALLPCISLSQHPRQSTTPCYTTTLSSRCSTLLVQTPLYYYVFLSHSTQGGVLLHVTRRPYHYPAALSWFEPCSITMHFSLTAPKAEYYHTLHDGPIVTLQRSPFFRDIVLLVGGWTFSIWKEGVTVSTASSNKPHFVSQIQSLALSRRFFKISRMIKVVNCAPGASFIKPSRDIEVKHHKV